MKIQVALVSLYLCQFSVLSTGFTVATYNLWNLMFNWDVRKHRIARMIKESGADVVALQEVRTDADGFRSQLSDLQDLLPEFRWKLYKEANNVTLAQKVTWNGWEKEGIGILSRLPIVFFSFLTLPTVQVPDTNKRVVLFARIYVNSDISVPVISVHFSYDRKQQCRNAQAVIQYLTEKSIRYAIVLGDFNTYNDFNWPVELFTSMDQKSKRICGAHTLKPIRSLAEESVSFTDLKHISQSGGLTFSNMPTPGYVSRPDRILVTSNLLPESVSLHGNGSYYKTHYRQSILIHRLKTLIYNSYLSFHYVEGYSCFQDCGPHGVCRCGVCVKKTGQETENCFLPSCVECDSTIYMHFVGFSLASVIVFIHLLYSSLCILLSGSDFQGEAVFAILGCNCCLCNPSNFKFLNFNSRKYRIMRAVRKWPPFHLPPCILFVISVISGVFLLLTGSYVFKDSLNTLYSIMEEEFNLSDHLMLVSKLNMKSIGPK